MPEGSEPVFRAPHATVTLAEDTAAGETLRRVALKTLTSAEDFRHELQAREDGGFSATRVLRILRYHKAERCLVTPRAERSLQQSAEAERFCWHTVVGITHAVAVAVMEMHEHGWVHGWIVPGNVVRVGETWPVRDVCVVGRSVGRSCECRRLSYLPGLLFEFTGLFFCACCPSLVR